MGRSERGEDNKGLRLPVPGFMCTSYIYISSNGHQLSIVFTYYLKSE